jgi:hypothetical protein
MKIGALKSDMHSRSQFLKPAQLLTADQPADTQGSSSLIIKLESDGRLHLTGSRQALEDFLPAIAQVGMVVELDFLNWCG